MDLTPIIEKHMTLAPTLIFIGAILAGLNLPISIDVLLIFCIFAYATVSAKIGIFLFLTLMAGCIASSHIAYGLGRLVGPKLLKLPPFKWFISDQRLKKVKRFYSKHGNWLYFVARFIPFGVRNAVFYTSGITKVPILRYFMLESAACLLWGTTFFVAFTSLSANREALAMHLKIVNICLFIAFSVTVIGVICYKVKKRAAK